MVSDPNEVRQMDYVPVTLEWMLDVRAEELDKIMRCESAIYSGSLVYQAADCYCLSGYEGVRM
ncbi:hypothetical protein Tsubulata_039674 [Turnera subulata]|uniref:Uncharacterized protein n=1 Tax=Turnera subulata TaxID=218843 RepID=A0A9Q0F3W9_9ROSI|nr:hypothetical protein Tsubulata_039674 [Turnera subulata]